MLHVFRHFPLDSHPNASPAAKAAYCAGQQNPEFFWAMHDWIFANQATWASAQDAAAQFRTQAVSLDVNATQYDECLAAASTEEFIQKDILEGVQMGVQGTPAFFVNDWFLAGAYPFAEFESLIAKAQQGLHPPPTPTPLPPGVAPWDVDPERAGRSYDSSPTRGADDAPVVIVGFADFKCEACAKYATDVMPALKAKYVDTGKVRELFKFMPTEAPRAALASLCAADQEKFWEFHDLLYENQGDWQDGDETAMLKYAAEIGLDAAAFSTCLEDAPWQAHLDGELELAANLGLPEPPAYLFVDVVEGRVVDFIVGDATAADFESKIEAVLNPVAEPSPTP